MDTVALTMGGQHRVIVMHASLAGNGRKQGGHMGPGEGSEPLSIQGRNYNPQQANGIEGADCA